MSNNIKVQCMNHYCRFTFRHMLVDGSVITRTQTIFINEKNKDVLEDDRIVGVYIIRSN